MKKTYTQEQQDFIQKNYSSMGAVKCSKKLGLSDRHIRKIAGRLGIKVDKKIRGAIARVNAINRPPKQNSQYSVNPEQFYDIKTAAIAYILGFIWADGYVYSKNYQHKISIYCLKEDFDEILPIINQTGNWPIFYRKRQNRRMTGEASISNKPLVKFLIHNDYTSKSHKSASKILNKIPEHLKRYWFLGLIDGDGCFYYNKLHRLQQFSVCSSYDQDWGFLTNLLKSLGVRSKVTRRIQGKNKHSVVRVCGYKNIQKIFNYLYPNNYEIGFTRKYQNAALCSKPL